MLIYQLRQAVFMIEQNCLYEDIDGLDPDCLHLMHYQDDELIAYLRIVPPGLHFKNPALGRIIVTPKYRGGSTGPSLIHEGISLCRKHYQNLSISIEAQYPLESYYRQFGFESCGEVYIVDEIPYIHMILNP